MSFELADIQYSNKICYYLLKNGQLTEEDNMELYRAYADNETIMNLVKEQGEAIECLIKSYGGVIYLIPKEDNDFLGFSKGELKRILGHSKATDKDYYLSQFAIITLLVEFYKSHGSTARSREYLRGGDFLNILSIRLAEGVSNSESEEKETEGVAYANIAEKFESLKSADVGGRAKTTKEGFILGILKFLEKQGLIQYIEQDDMIFPTKKMDNFMDWDILNKANYFRVLRVFGEETNE